MSVTITQGSTPSHLIVEGDTRDLWRMYVESERTQEFSLLMCGVGVSNVKRDTRHGDVPALAVTLVDGVFSREIGRLVIQDRTDFRDIQPRWELWFDVDEEAARYLREFDRANDLVTAELSMSFLLADKDRLFAEWSRDHGCSFSLVRPHAPATGHPVVSVYGFRAQVIRWLEDVYCDEHTQSPEFYLGEAPGLDP